MIKKHAVCAMVLCAALTVFGCSSIARQMSAKEIVYDESLPPEQTAFVVFSDTIYVREYNGIPVGEAWYPNGKLRINKVTLPAGETSILFNFWMVIDRGRSILNIKADDIELRFTFEAGKEYTVAAYTKSQGFFKDTEYGVAVWGYASQTATPGSADESKILKSWKLGTF